MTWTNKILTRLKTTAGALALSMFAAVGAVGAADHSTGGYIGIDYTFGDMGDVSAEYRGTTNASYELDDADDSGSVSFGYDWGNIRSELKSFAKKKFDNGFDYMISGHYHLGEMHVMNNCKLAILGDWFSRPSYAVFDGEELYFNLWSEDD